MDEARRTEQEIHRKRQVYIPKKIFLVGREKLTGEKNHKVDAFMENYIRLKGFIGLNN